MGAAALTATLTATLSATLCLAPAATARAQTGITVYGGWRDGSGFESSGVNRGEPLRLRSGGAASLAFEWPYDDHRLWQVFASQQRTRLALGSTGAAPGTATEMPLGVRHLHLGGVNYFEEPVARIGRGPFVSGGIGFTQLSPGLPGTSTRTRASMSLGIGYEWPLLANALSLRLELRGYAVLIRSEGGFFCSGGCTVFVQGDALAQAEALLGLRLAF
jgi:hypothetical protein